MAISMTPAATERVKSFMDNRGKGLGLRLGVKTTGCSGLAYVLEFVDELMLMMKFLNSMMLISSSMAKA